MTSGISRIRRAGVGVLATLTATAGLVPFAMGAGAASNLTVTRFAGEDRFDTGRLVAAAFGASPTVVIARGDLFPDALAGAYVAGANNAAILLVRSDSVPATTTAALQQTGATSAIILGGTTAISTGVENALRARPMTVNRIGGATRYDTAQLVAQSSPAASVGSLDGLKTAIVATGQNFPDALAASPLSYASRFPIILTPTASLGSQARAALTNLAIKNVLIVGGAAAVADGVETEIKAMGIASVNRLAGGTRTSTATAIADFAIRRLGFTNRRIGLARGDDFADALTYGPLAGKSRPTVAPAAGTAQTPASAPNPVILTNGPTSLGEDAYNWAVANAPTVTQAEILGGFAAISAAVEQIFTDALRSGGALFTFTSTNVQSGGAVSGTVSGQNIQSVTVSGCGLTNQPVTGLTSTGGNFTFNIPASQANGTTCTLTFTTTFVGGRTETDTQTITVGTQANNVDITASPQNAPQGGSTTITITPRNQATINTVTVSGCGFTNQNVRTGGGSAVTTHTLTIPAGAANGACTLTFTTTFLSGQPSETDNVAFNVGTTAPVTATSRTTRPELVSSSVISTQPNTALEPGTIIRYCFDEAITGAITTNAALFHVYEQIGAQQNGVVPPGINGAGSGQGPGGRHSGSSFTSAQGTPSPRSVASDNKCVDVRFSEITTTATVGSLTVATVDAGAVTGSLGTAADTNPEGDAPLGTTGSQSFAAGVTSAPDLLRVENFRAGGANGTTANATLVDFVFDEPAFTTNTSGFHLISQDGVTDITCEAVSGTAAQSGGLGSSAVSTIVVACPGTAATSPNTSPSNFVAAQFGRGSTDSATVRDPENNFNPLQAADVVGGSTTNGPGNTETPDLVSAQFRPNQVVTVNGANQTVDQVLYTFDEPVVLNVGGSSTNSQGTAVTPTSPAAACGNGGAANTPVAQPTVGTAVFSNGTCFRIYLQDSTERNGGLANGGAAYTGSNDPRAPQRSTSSDRDVLVSFPAGTLGTAVGASVTDGAVLEALAPSRPNQQDEESVLSSASVTSGRTEGPDLIGVALSQVTDQFNTVTGGRAIFSLDEAVIPVLDVDAGKFKLWQSDGTLLVCNGTNAAGTFRRGGTGTPTTTTSQVVCESFVTAAAVPATGQQIAAATLGTVAFDAVRDQGVPATSNPEGAEPTTGGNGTPAA